MNEHQFTLEFDVRDYECDLQGIVNNAQYQHYLEHTRHVFLKERGIDFAELTAQGIFLVVSRIEIDFLHPLRSGDRFLVGLDLFRISPLRFGFRQPIYRLPDGKPIIRSLVTGTGMSSTGRPRLPKTVEDLLEFSKG